MVNRKKLLLFTFSLVFYSLAWAQLPKISVIEVYGNRKISSARILASINKKEGDVINPPTFKPDTIVAAIKRIPAVKQVTVNPLCCDTGNSYIVYIGVAESDSAYPAFRPSPQKNVQLSNKMVNAYRNFNQQVRTAAMKGQGSEAYVNGYSLLTYPAARKIQLTFIGFANQNFQELTHVLKHSKHAEQRAAAAQIIAYATDKEKVVECLLYAIKDADENVRNNATRALGILADHLSESPHVKVSIPAAPFIDMLNSLSWTDRNKGAMALVQLTQHRDPDVLHQLKAKALPSVLEMAKWKHRAHALFSFILLSRMAGEDESLILERNFSSDWPELANQLEEKIHSSKKNRKGRGDRTTFTCQNSGK